MSLCGRSVAWLLIGPGDLFADDDSDEAWMDWGSGETYLPCPHVVRQPGGTTEGT